MKTFEAEQTGLDSRRGHFFVTCFVTQCMQTPIFTKSFLPNVLQDYPDNITFLSPDCLWPQQALICQTVSPWHPPCLHDCQQSSAGRDSPEVPASWKAAMARLLRVSAPVGSADDLQQHCISSLKSADRCKSCSDKCPC